MQNKISEIKNRIFGKSRETTILDRWNYLMLHYGWIPFEEFKKLDAYIVDELIIKLNKMNEKANKSSRRRR